MFAACGYVGDTLPPALNLPARVTDLSAVQHGGLIRITFTMPTLTTEALPIRGAPAVDLRIGSPGARFVESDWLAHSRQIPATAAPKQLTVETPAADFANRTVVLAVRLFNDREKTAGWSNFVQLSVTSPLARPESVTARAVPQGVELTWTGAAPLFRVYRKDAAAAAFAPLGEARTSPYTDTTAEFGKPYTYFVQGLQSPDANASQSDVSEDVSITPRDVFPPAVPVNLRAVVGATTIELSWDRNTEPDLAGYRLYRAEGDAAFTPAGGTLAAPSYSDRAVRPATRYRYAVTALDTSGNESEHSPPVAVVLP